MIPKNASKLLAQSTPSYEKIRLLALPKILTACGRSSILIIKETHVVEQGGREKGESSTEAGPHQIVTRQHAGRILRVCVRQVIEHGVEEQNGADGEPGAADNGHDPVDTIEQFFYQLSIANTGRGRCGGFLPRPRTPPEPKQADWNTETSYASGRKSLLRLYLTVHIELLLLYDT